MTVGGFILWTWCWFRYQAMLLDVTGVLMHVSETLHTSNTKMQSFINMCPQ